MLLVVCLGSMKVECGVCQKVRILLIGLGFEYVCNYKIKVYI